MPTIAIVRLFGFPSRFVADPDGLPHKTVKIHTNAPCYVRTLIGLDVASCRDQHTGGQHLRMPETPNPRDHSTVDSAWRAQFERDALGHRVHTHVGVVAGACLAGPTTALEIAGVVLGLYALLRLTHTLALGIAWLRLPTTIVWGAVLAWTALAILWSADTAEGLDQLQTHRWLLLGAALFAVADQRDRIMTGFLAGVLIGNAVQLLQFIAVGVGWEALDFDRPTRISGWWGPAISATILTTAFAMHLPGAALGRGRARWLSLIGAGAASFGLLASGARAGWIAALVLLLIACSVAVRSALRSGDPRARWGLLGGAIVLVTIAGTAWATVGDRVGARTQEAVREVRDAWTDGRTDGSVSLRIAMMSWAVDAFQEHPVVGVGTGEFQDWAYAHDPRARGTPNPDGTYFWNCADHAHCTPLHVAACQGLVGVVLLLIAFTVSMLSAVRHVRPGRWGTLDAAPVWGLGALALMSAFDVPLVSTHGAAVVGLVLAMVPWSLPGPARPTEGVRRT